MRARDADLHIHELRKARVSWVKILEESNYASTQALEALQNISVKIETIKSLFPGDFAFREPTLEEIEGRSQKWTMFVSEKDIEL